MGNLILNSLEIQRFRGFRHLQIERLGRVNLIVGKNNVGKTALLEALQLYVYDAFLALIWQFLRERDERTYNLHSRVSRSAEILDTKYLFYGRKDISAHLDPILVGPINSPEKTVSLSIEWYVTEREEDGSIKMKILQPEEYSTADNPVPRLTVQLGGVRSRVYTSGSSPLPGLSGSSINSVFIPANGLDRELVEDFWDKIVLRELEEDVLGALRIIAPGVERLSLAGDSDLRRRVVKEANLRERERVRVPIVRVKDIDEPIPLRSLGSGMQRMLGIALALANAKGGMLLIDEIENGLHYSVQTDLWRLIFQLAHRLNVQVFVTTHSWDCIQGFQVAAQEDSYEEAMLIRLEIKEEEIEATLFDERKLGIATREQIEVR